MLRGGVGRRSAVRLGGIALAAGLVGLAAAPSPVAAARARLARPASSSSTHFSVTATSSNTVGVTTAINNAATNGKPHALLFVSPSYAYNGVCGCVYENHPIGVYYTSGEWVIFNQDSMAMALGTEFNVLVVSAPSSTAFVLTATSPSGDSAFINSPKTNSKTSVKLQVTQLLDPGGLCPCVNNAHSVGVWYDRAKSEWAAFNEDELAMPAGASFNVLVGSTGGGKLAVQKATVSNSFADATRINNSLTNGHASAFVFSTPLWNPGGHGGVYDTDATGVWYDSPSWAVFQEDASGVPLGAAFNLLLYG